MAFARQDELGELEAETLEHFSMLEDKDKKLKHCEKRIERDEVYYSINRGRSYQTG